MAHRGRVNPNCRCEAIWHEPLLCQPFGKRPPQPHTLLRSNASRKFLTWRQGTFFERAAGSGGERISVAHNTIPTAVTICWYIIAGWLGATMSATARTFHIIAPRALDNAAEAGIFAQGGSRASGGALCGYVELAGEVRRCWAIAEDRQESRWDDRRRSSHSRNVRGLRGRATHRQG